MERKLVKQGQNALTVTVPSAFVKQNHLKAGDYVRVSFNANQLTIIPSYSAPTDREIIIDAHAFDRGMIFNQLLGAYILGFQRITILNAPLPITQSIPSRLIGVVIESQTKTKTTFLSLIRESDPAIESAIRRCGHLLVELSRIINERSQGRLTDEDIRVQENLLDQQLLYCLRTLHRFPPSDDNLYRYFLLCSTFESIGDQLQEIGYQIYQNPSMGQMVHDTIEFYVRMIFESNFNQLYSRLKKTKSDLSRQTFLDGLVFMLFENLHNNLGFLISTKNRQK